MDHGKLIIQIIAGAVGGNVAAGAQELSPWDTRQHSSRVSSAAAFGGQIVTVLLGWRGEAAAARRARPRLDPSSSRCLRRHRRRGPDCCRRHDQEGRQVPDELLARGSRPVARSARPDPSCPARLCPAMGWQVTRGRARMAAGRSQDAGFDRLAGSRTCKDPDLRVLDAAGICRMQAATPKARIRRRPHPRRTLLRHRRDFRPAVGPAAHGPAARKVHQPDARDGRGRRASGRGL